MAQIITLGEVLIDLTQTGTDESGIPQFTAFPGGAPANVAVAASRLGAKTGFIGKIGSDAFGAQLRETLEKDHVDTACLFASDEVPTTLAIVSVDEHGERSFAFYRNPGADTQLTEEEATAFLKAELPFILHFGSLSLTTEPSRSAALAAVQRAREKGVLISYDPNYRAALWSSEEEAIRWMKAPLDSVDILKISDEELMLLTGTDDLQEGSRRLSEYGISLILITLGSKGVFYRLCCGDEAEHLCGLVPAEKVSVCDTNGAGDTFLGAVLMRLADKGSIPADSRQMEAIMSFANRAAALTCSRAGAIPAMPTAEELGEM
ncbi:MAG: carbohydrate kinase [Clostridia bacterium]|nr:carbohydrate kinase [Clostridia bacterium]